MVVLLDIDGVMVPASNWKRPELLKDGFPDFSGKAVSGMNKIISATGAAILLTTTHRDSFSVNEWTEIFACRGINAVISKLCSIDKRLNRKEEILKWMQLHEQNEPFVIIDDDKSLNDLPVALKKKLVLTSPLVGLTDELAEHATNILKQIPDNMVVKRNSVTTTDDPVFL